MPFKLFIFLAFAVILPGCAHHRVEFRAHARKLGQLQPTMPSRPFLGSVTPVSILNNITFEFDRATLSVEGRKEADRWVAELRKWYKDRIVVQGHTCDIGTSDYNLALGAKRAQVVADYIVQQGIDPSRVSTTTFGEELPAVPNDCEKNRAFNRRVVFEFSHERYPELEQQYIDSIPWR